MDNPQDLKSLQDQIQAALLSVTRTAGQISSEDLSFHRSLNPSFGTSLDEQSARLLAISSSLLKSAASISDLEVPVLQDAEDVDNNWRSVVDVVDSLLEKADTSLDEYTGVLKRKTPPTTEQSPLKLKKYQPLGYSFRTQNLVKPQLAFLNKPDNTTTDPWKPILTSKPHAIIPLTESLSTFTDELQHPQYDYTFSPPFLNIRLDRLSLEDTSKPQKRELSLKTRRQNTMDMSKSTNNRTRFKHPYETEILEMQYPATVYHKAHPISPKDVNSTRATFVDTFEGVLTMLAELKSAKEIAVDLEHHDTRTYVGLVSLMQISTREKNWIVDTLKPWRQDLQVLNEIFADPKIIKVFHGAHMDIVWLQRDLGLYVVGLFDTHHASRALGYPGGSLAYLLKRFVDFDADKKYQMADWRIRPLPKEMFFYAMTDTHFLLYIFDNLRNELVEQSNPTDPEETKIGTVLQKSKETSLLRFERQIYEEGTGKGPSGWYTLLVRTPAFFNNEQFAVFRAVHAWRDQIARKDDDSVNYVMPNHVVFTVAKSMPMDMASLYGTLHPISHNVKSRAAELLALIKSAKASGKDGPSMMDVLRPDSIGATLKARGSSGTSSRKAEYDLALKHLSTDFSQLRTEKSMFWGSAFGSSFWDGSSASSRTNTDLRLAVPLPQIVSELPSNASINLADRSRSQDGEKASQTEPETSISHDDCKEEDEVFTIKSGRKDKAKIIGTDSVILGESSKDYDISFNEDDEENSRNKLARKAERKAQKKLAKAARKHARGDGANGSGVELKEEEEETFDYSKANSVLHGKQKEANKDGSKKPFDPYAKSSNAPKGIRKHTERAGKSFTFKS